MTRFRRRRVAKTSQQRRVKLDFSACDTDHVKTRTCSVAYGPVDKFDFQIKLPVLVVFEKANKTKFENKLRKAPDFKVPVMKKIHCTKICADGYKASLSSNITVM